MAWRSEQSKSNTLKKYSICAERIKFLITSQVNYSLRSGRLSTMHFLITNRVTGAANKYWREGFSTSLLKVNKKSSQFMFIWLFSWQMYMTIQYSVLKKIVMASCLSKKNVPRDYQSVLSGTIIGHSQTHPLNLISLSILPIHTQFQNPVRLIWPPCPTWRRAQQATGEGLADNRLGTRSLEREGQWISYMVGVLAKPTPLRDRDFIERLWEMPPPSALGHTCWAMTVGAEEGQLGRPWNLWGTAPALLSSTAGKPMRHWGLGFPVRQQVDPRVVGSHLLLPGTASHMKLFLKHFLKSFLKNLTWRFWSSFVRINDPDWLRKF